MLISLNHIFLLPAVLSIIVCKVSGQNIDFSNNKYAAVAYVDVDNGLTMQLVYENKDRATYQDLEYIRYTLGCDGYKVLRVKKVKHTVHQELATIQLDRSTLLETDTTWVDWPSSEQRFRNCVVVNERHYETNTLAIYDTRSRRVLSRPMWSMDLNNIKADSYYCFYDGVMKEDHLFVDEKTNEKLYFDQTSNGLTIQYINPLKQFIPMQIHSIDKAKARMKLYFGAKPNEIYTVQFQPVFWNYMVLDLTNPDGSTQKLKQN